MPSVLPEEPPVNVHQWWMRWLIPDVRMASALLLIVYALVRVNISERLFADSDPGWHIRVGDWIVQHRALPQVDWMSFVTAGRPWYAWEWLAELLMSGIHSWLGLAGIAAFYLGVIGGGLWLWIHAQKEMGASLVLSCLLAAPMVTATQIHWLARPHLLSWLLIFLLLILLERGGTRFGWKQAAVWLGLFCLWANTHGSFMIGIQFVGAYCAAWLVRPWIWKASDRAACWQRARWYGWAALCAAGGSLVNPYGFQLHWHVVDFLMHPEIVEGVSEWLRPDLLNPNAGQLTLAVGLTAAGCLLSLRVRRLEWFLVGALVLVMSLRVTRGVPMLGLVGIPVFTAALTAWLREIREKSNWAGGFLAFSEQIEEFDRGFHGGAVGLAAVVLLVLWARDPANQQKTGWNPRMYPAQASRYLDRQPDNVRIYAIDTHSGYLTYVFNGRKQIFLDSRSDFYGKELYHQVRMIYEAKPGWQAVFDEYRFTHALVHKGSPISQALSKRGWKAVYEDGSFLILAP